MVQPHLFYRLLTLLFGLYKRSPHLLELTPQGLRLTYSDKLNPIEVEISEPDVCRVSPVFLGSRLELTPATTYAQAVMVGVSTEDAKRVRAHVSTLKQAARERREAEERAQLEEQKQAERVYLNQEEARLTKLAKRLDLKGLLSAYLGKRAHRALSKALSVDDLKLLMRVNTSDLLTTPPAGLTELAKLLSPLMSGARLTEPKRVAHNQRFIQSERKRHKALFDGIEANPLTDKQAEACVVNEEVTLVVAGAGTGKTSTVVGRCAYLLKAGLASPSELLLLAYGRKASEEMSERLTRSLGAQKIHASTFHSLGLSIIGEVEGKKPSLASFVSHDSERGGYFKALQEELFQSEPTYLTQALSFFKTHLNDSRSAFDPPDAKSYYDFLRSRQFVTLKGEIVKGYCEVLIANELYLGGVSYEYEAPYQHNTADAKHRRYQPDFYLPEHDLYIEFYGVNRQGKTAPYIDSERYQREMTWKRETHQKHNTTCLELFYYQHQEGSLLHDLWESLERRGVKRVERSEEEALNELKESKLIDAFSDLLASFTSLFKLSLRSLDELKRTARSSPRMSAFLLIFERVFSAYESKLKRRGEVDFEDMIARAVDYVKTGRYRSPYTHLIIDEFQDISPARFTLLKALWEQREGARLFCVGDDWQSIYRFSGGDLSLMTQLDQRFEYSERLSLDRTFRFNDALLELSSAFVQLNPSLYRKQLKAHVRVGAPRAELYYYQHSEGQTLLDRVWLCLHRIAEDASNEKLKRPKVFLISRYHFNLERADLKRLRAELPSLDIKHLTAHASKGREADYVIILSLENKLFGFPNRTSDDPIINLVLPHQEPFEDAEESRLLYVALTRAKRHVYLLASLDAPSDFITTLKRFDRWLLEAPGDPLKPSGVTCPKCKAGSLILKKSSKGRFASCSLYPVCMYGEDACTQCHQGIYQPISDRQARCNQPSCRHLKSLCPSCQSGTLTLRQGRYGSFFGCSQYPSCEHSEDACERCGAGQYEPAGERTSRCANPVCGHEVERCPQCRAGFIKQKTGRYGDFMGCSNYKNQAIPCRYTRKL